jgi:hypothetical protein
VNPLEELAKKAAEASAANLLAATTTEKVKDKTYYSNIAGSTYIFSDGSVAQFTNGAYVTDREFEQKELDALVKHHGNHHVYDHEVAIQNPNDSLLLKEVGKGGTGMVSSANLAALATLSRRS